MKPKIAAMIFILRNLYYAKNISKFAYKSTSRITLRGYENKDARQVKEFYEKLNPGSRFSYINKWLYTFAGSRLVLVATASDDSGETVVGINMYYFNYRDIKENTIHEAFIGVSPQMRGEGLATTMRILSRQNFMQSGLSGISNRISISNNASLVSAKKVGFTPVEEYIDPITDERRYYMISKFIKGDL